MPSRKQHRFEPGETVRILKEDRIRSTLDEDGTLDGLPFMPEMRKYCGRVGKVSVNVHKILVEGVGYRILKGCVLLEGVTCNGKMHHGCQRMCNIFWKIAWLEPAGKSEPSASGPKNSAFGRKYEEQTIIRCQSGSLKSATTEPSLSLEDWVRRYVCHAKLRRYWFLRKVCAAFLLSLLYVKRFLGISKQQLISGPLKVTPKAALDLQSGELVEIKNRDDILATLDKAGKNRGLAFTPEMAAYCGARYRVLRSVSRLIDEATGTERNMSNTVVLENVLCDGSYHLNCPRRCYLLWRDIWLRRI